MHQAFTNLYHSCAITCIANSVENVKIKASNETPWNALGIGMFYLVGDTSALDIGSIFKACTLVKLEFAHENLTILFKNPYGYIKKNGTDTRLVCAHLNAFVMLNPDKTMKITFFIFFKYFLEKHFSKLVLSFAADTCMDRFIIEANLRQCVADYISFC